MPLYNPSASGGGVVGTAAALEYPISGGGSVIPVGIAGDLEVPYNCTIVGVRALGDQTGSLVVDIWNDTYANYPPTDADTITASAPVTISTADKSEDTTLTGWDVDLIEGDILRFNVDSVTDIEFALIVLDVVRA